MKIVANFVFIIFLCGLILSLVFWLSPLNTDDERRTVGLADVLKTVSEAPAISMDWVDDYLTFAYEGDLEEPEPVFSEDMLINFDFTKFLQGLFSNAYYQIQQNSDLVEFIDTWFLGPIRIMAICGTFGLNILIYFGYFISVVF